MAEDKFLHRWSRRKHEAARPTPAPAAPAAPVPVAAAVAEAAVQVPAPVDPTSLPPVESLTLASDFKPFLSAKVEETVKRQALRKLFSDPHFNVMDGLDVYIDDYSKPDPLPEGLLDKLADVYKTLEEKSAEAAQTETAVAAADVTPPDSTDPETRLDQDADEPRG